jgi:hypothetical protein
MELRRGLHGGRSEWYRSDGRPITTGGRGCRVLMWTSPGLGRTIRSRGDGFLDKTANAEARPVLVSLRTASGTAFVPII